LVLSLGIKPLDAKRVIDDALGKAQTNGVPAAASAQVEVTPLQEGTGAKVTIGGLSDEQAQALWE
jgi:hypothetical protein